MVKNPFEGMFVPAGGNTLPQNAGTLSSRVHGFMDANPQLGPAAGAGAPTRQMSRLFQQLMGQYGAGYLEGYQPAKDILGQMGVPVEEYEPDYASDFVPTEANLNDFRLERFLREPQETEGSNSFNTWRYDSKQPYGWDFAKHELNWNDEPYDTSDFAADYGEYFAPGSGRALTGEGEIVSAPSDPQLPSVVGQFARTAGSMALPMLFNMLLRGGK